MQHGLIVLTKTKTTIRYCELFGHSGKTLATQITNDLAHVSVPIEDGSQQSTTFTHALRGSSTCMSTHAPSGPALSYPLHVLQAKHKHQTS
jgi:hypothetical protein